MPKISRLFIKTGLIYFLASLILGIAIEIDFAALPVLYPLFWHMLMVGWITQIIFGVSMWMFPGRTREEGFIPRRWCWLTYFFLNGGLLLRVAAEPMLTYGNRSFWKYLVIVSALLQLSAGVTYLVEMWPRVQSKKQRRRNRKKRGRR